MIHGLYQGQPRRCLFVLETDEHEHGHSPQYSPDKECSRLRRIQAAVGIDLYVLRFNLHGENCFSPDVLSNFFNHVLSILDQGYIRAFQSPGSRFVDFVGYSPARQILLVDQMTRQVLFNHPPVAAMAIGILPAPAAAAAPVAPAAAAAPVAPAAAAAAAAAAAGGADGDGWFFYQFNE
jgi:hypothetical protein